MRVAIIGCGQLARMLALAGLPMGIRFSFVSDTPDEDTRCVEGLGNIVRWQPGGYFGALYQSLGSPDFITVEKEQVDISLLQGLEAFCNVYPDSRAFSLCQDRYKEKQLLSQLEIPSSPYILAKEIPEAIAQLSLPLVAKSRREGYDGKNQFVLVTQEEVDAFYREQSLEDFILEQWVPFERELSQISMRSQSGEIAHYALTENSHEQGILRHSLAPAESSEGYLKAKSEEYISRILRELNYVGVLAMECFVVDGELMINELAPRVHNSGHWTQSGSLTCQFENHLRAVCALPLGSTDHTGLTGMVNLIGDKEPPLVSFSEHSTLHWYNKSSRPGRKLGHVNFVDQDYVVLKEKLEAFRLLGGARL